MAARPPISEPPTETVDGLPDETAPPQKSPLRAVVPFARNRAGKSSAPGHTDPAQGAPFGEETAPPQRSPLADALPFRHAKASSPTVAMPAFTAEDLSRLGLDAAKGPAPSSGPSARNELESAPTVAFHLQERPPASQNTSSQPPPAAGPPSQPPPPSGTGRVAARSTGHFGLSIEQYAALCAEIAVFPTTSEAIFAKYGLASAKDRMTADIGWQERLRGDAALMARWQGLYLHYHEHYSRRG